MQSVSSRIWTRIATFISYGDNDYTTGTSWTSVQSGPGSDGNEGVLCIPRSSCITGTSLSDCLVSYPGHPLAGGITLQQRRSRCIRTSPSDWVNEWLVKHIGLFSLGKQTNVGERKLCIQTSCSPLWNLHSVVVYSSLLWDWVNTQTHAQTHVYIYIYIERERESKRSWESILNLQTPFLI